MRSVIGTAPSTVGLAPGGAGSLSPGALFASTGTYAAARLAATLVPVVKRNLRRVGSGGHDCRSSSDIRTPCKSVRLKFHVLYTRRGSSVEHFLLRTTILN